MVVKDSGTEVLTKHEKEWKNVCYNLKDKDKDNGNDEEQGEGDKAPRSRGEGRDAAESNGLGSRDRQNGRIDVDALPGAITTRRMRDKGNM